jgi:hypothetical protein
VCYNAPGQEQVKGEEMFIGKLLKGPFLDADRKKERRGIEVKTSI